MSWAILGAAVALSAGFGAANVFRFRRMRARDNEHMVRKDQARREHHYGGSLDMELEQGPPTRDD